MIGIRPTVKSIPPDGKPPVFQIETDDHPFYGVQVSTDPYLFNGAASARRARANFFDSWTGHAPAAGTSGQSGVPGQHLESGHGKATYALPGPVWAALRPALLKERKLYYRVVVADNEQRKKTWASTADTDWKKAPAVSVAAVPQKSGASPYASFKGKNVLTRTDFLDAAKKQLAGSGIVGGRDGDFCFVVMDASQFDMTAIECHEHGLTDTVAKMPMRPDAVVNAQFVGGRTGIGIDMEGQTVREGALINTHSTTARSFLSQAWNATRVEDIHVGVGNPASAQPNDRVAFGGLGPLLQAGAPPARLSAWARSIYDKPVAVGRGALALDRMRSLIVLVVQMDRTGLFDKPANAMTMHDLRAWLQRIGCTDALFNDGSDSESLFANNGWLVKPGLAKDESIDFAVGFVRRGRARRLRVLAIDGTTSGDGRAFLQGLDRLPITHFRADNIGEALASAPDLGAIANTFRRGLLEAGRADTQAKADLVGSLFRNAGHGGKWADLLYFSSHAYRHGQLWYHRGGGDSGPVRMVADPWAAGFRANWRNTPKWIVIAGCAVLGLHYARLRRLTASESSSLVAWHKDIHGSGAGVPGLDGSKKVLFAVYHPGWAWYDRVFRTSGVRGVLGYWFRSPGSDAGDVEIVESFTKSLRAGATLLEAWKSANQRGLFEAQAAWAAMVREGCESDTAATLEQPSLPAVDAEFLYYDRWQNGNKIADAFSFANKRAEVVTIGSAPIVSSGRERYDRIAFGADRTEIENANVGVARNSLLVYDDGVRP